MTSPTIDACGDSCNDRKGVRRRQRRCCSLGMRPTRALLRMRMRMRLRKGSGCCVKTSVLLMALFCCAWMVLFAPGSSARTTPGTPRPTVLSPNPPGRFALASASAFPFRRPLPLPTAFHTSGTPGDTDADTDTDATATDATETATATAAAQSETTAAAVAFLYRLRGGSSRGSGGGGGSLSYRPTPPKSMNPNSNSNSNPNSNFDSAGRWNRNTQQEQLDEEEDEERVREIIDSFLTRDSRNTFIARVYGILSVQLVFTALTCLLFGTFAPLTNIYVVNSVTGRASPFLFVPLAGVLLSTVAWFRVAVSPEARQKSPNKWWWLAVFTIGESVSIGAISSLYKLRSVIMAMGATALAAGTVSLYTISQKNSKYDLSQWGATLSSWATILLVYLLIGVAQQSGWLPFGFLPFSDMLYSVFATCLFSVFLAYHTKLIVGGKHAKYRMNEQDYVFGAMALYVDIVNIFLNLLQLLGEERER